MPPLRRKTVEGLYLGLDPGVNGGLARYGPSFLSPSSESYHIRLQPMPETERDIWEWFKEARSDADNEGWSIFAVVEWIHPAIQGVGKASMSKLYGSYMRLRACLIAADIPFEDAQAAKWQRALGISPRLKTESDSQWKNRLKGRAQQLFPRETLTLKTADSLLIAEYCRRKRQGLL